MRHDVKFWWLQRATAVFAVPFALYAIILLVLDLDDFGALTFLNNHPFALTVLSLLTIYHGALGMQVILEDYISCAILRNICISVLYAVSGFTVLAILFILIKLLS